MIVQGTQGGARIRKTDLGLIFFLRQLGVGLTNYVIRNISKYSKYDIIFTTHKPHTPSFVALAPVQHTGVLDMM